MDVEPGQKVGRYTVIERLGQGGMSNVYRARDDQENRDVVLKFPHQDILGDIATHERFSREVKIGQLLNHDHIQHLYELGNTGYAEYLVLEYVPGEPLRRVLRGRKPPSTPAEYKEIVDIGIQIGSALTYAHSHHVFHRDMKPENIILTPDGIAKVMDFGIALLKGSRRVTWGPLSTQVGTPDYMAPEQIQGGRGDARTDVYALGTILYEMIAGRLPYEGDNPLAIMNQHVNVKPPPIHKFRSGVPPALEEIVMKAIRIKPADRWQSIDDFMAALKGESTVDVAALRAEREGETDNGKAAGAMGKLPVPVSRATLIIMLAIIALLAAAVIVGPYLRSGHGH